MRSKHYTFNKILKNCQLDQITLPVKTLKSSISTVKKKSFGYIINFFLEAKKAINSFEDVYALCFILRVKK